jgi:hypothetical protein
MPDITFGGGLNETDPDEISIEECFSGFNFLLDAKRKNFEPRPPQDLVDTATNGKPIRGIMQMIDTSDTATTLIKAGEVIYSWDGSSFTSERSTDITTASRMSSTYWSLDDILLITDMDKNDPLFKWDGTSVLRLKTGLVKGTPAAVSQLSFAGSTATAIHSTHGFTSGDLVSIAGASESEYNGEYEITVSDADTYTYTISGSPATPITTTITADLGVELKAKYSVVKDNRVWLFNINTDGTTLPHAILASKFEDPENFDTAVRGTAQDATSTFTTTTKSDPFFLLSPDLRPINGATFFLNTLVISTEGGKLYRLTGSDPSDYNFIDYYSGSAAGNELSMVNTGNDVMYAKRGGEIDRLSDTDRSGDVSVDDATIFLPTTRLLLENPRGVYDQARQRVLWFEEGFVLVFDKGIALTAPNLSPWSKWTTLMPNGFQTEAATFLRRPGKSTFSIYWGDAEGKIYDLNGVGREGDAGEYSIECSRRSRYIVELPSNFSMIEGRVLYQRSGACVGSLVFDWGEEFNETTCALPFSGTVQNGDPNFWNESDLYWGEDEYWSEGTVVGDVGLDGKFASVGFSAQGRSPGFAMTISLDCTEEFKIHKVTV